MQLDLYAAGREYIKTQEATVPDEERLLTCPWCGYTAITSAQNMRVYHLWKDNGIGDEEGVCGSMALVRNHALAAMVKVRQQVDADHKKKTEPRSFNDYLRFAIASWGMKATSFIPTNYLKELTS